MMVCVCVLDSLISAKNKKKTNYQSTWQSGLFICIISSSGRCSSSRFKSQKSENEQTKPSPERSPVRGH